MAQQITEAQGAAVQQMMAYVESAYRNANAARTALSMLIAAGAATCTDIRTYNLQVKAVYAYQASVAGIIRANGGQAPTVPAPIYVVYKGIAGEQAANIDCGAAQLRGWAANGLGDYRVNPAQVEWRQEAMPSDTQLVARVVAQAGNAAVAAGGLGNPLLAAIPIIIIGVIVIVAAVIVLRIVEALTDIPGKKETTKQIAMQAEQHKLTLEARASCYTACTAAGKDPVECAKACDRLTPSFVAKYPGGGWGIFGTVAGVAVLGLVVYAGYRYASAGGGMKYGGWNTGGGHHKALPAGRDNADAIDAEYEERAA